MTPPPRRPGFGLVVATVAGLALLFLSVPNIAPAFRAARGDGTPGVFTAEQVSCVQHPGHEACSWSGTFRGPAGQRDVSLYGADRDALRPGQQVRAIDVGRPNLVYGPGGSREWIFVLVLLVAGCALLVPLARTLSRGRTTRGRPTAAAASM
ncbi:hypothetical protein [Planotetraspora sp. GP83]|uniref:hypothetical protein n=1 Tax=Planotetraspora sp. GP83 TaxID=3156264 RepID=UPI003511B70E